MITRLPEHVEWIEALVSVEDAALLEAMQLGEAVAEERGLTVFATDDPEAVQRALRQMERGQ